MSSARTVRFAIAGLALLLAQTGLAKVEVRPVQHQQLGLILVASFSEDIAPGDYEVLLKGILANPGRYPRKIAMLDSIGGSVPEAIRMGRLLRETGFDTLVPSTGVCQGTCVYLLAAGRRKTVRGPVAIHRPYYPYGDSSRAIASSGGRRYSSSAYFREMNIPPSLEQDMQRIAPEQMKVLSVRDLARYRLN